MNAKRFEIALNVVFWMLASWYLYTTSTLEVVGFEIIDGVQKNVEERNPDLVWYYVAGQFCNIVVFYIVLYLFARLRKTKAVIRYVVFVLLLIPARKLLFIVILRYIVFPEPLDSPIGDPLFSFFYGVALCYGFVKMWVQNEQEKKQLEIVKNQAELNLLRSQLQPHFLFNTMNNLLAMVDQDQNPKLAQSIDKLSGLLRYVVYDTKDEKVTLDQEVRFLQNFADLHLLRFEEDEIDFTMQVIGEYKDQLIEPGIFLCYVENAFKHGAEPEHKSFIHIHIDVTQSNRVNFSIENSIAKGALEKEEGGYGIQSNNERLKLAYPGKHTISFIDEDTYKVELSIITDESNHS